MNEPDVFEAFRRKNAQAINEARLSHLASLNLDLSNRRVLEVGAGVGNLTGFWLKRSCNVTSTEGRVTNVAEFRRRHPSWRIERIDLNSARSHAELGPFEIVFCYGTLYHLSQPAIAIESLANIATELFLIESRVYCLDDGEPHEVREGRGIDQSIDLCGHRPARDWVRKELSRSMPFVYMPLTQPEHPEFPLVWPSESLQNCRAIFVASRRRLNNPLLTLGLPTKQRWA